MCGEINYLSVTRHIALHPVYLWRSLLMEENVGCTSPYASQWHFTAYRL
jgi:hypothetical protein